ncbi:major facilitator superfamily protein, partial [Kipferlia bialata]|eukprot:g4117.t1
MGRVFQSVSSLPLLRHMSHNGVVATLTGPFFSLPYNNVVVYFTMYLLELGITERQVGIYQTILMTTQIFASLVSGYLADKYGREATVILFDILSWPGADLFWALSDTIYGQIVGGILNGINKVVYVSFMCLLTEKATSPQRLVNFSGFHFTLLVGGLFTPIGGWVVDKYGLVDGERILLLSSAAIMTTTFSIRHCMWERERGAKAGAHAKGAGACLPSTHTILDVTEGEGERERETQSEGGEEVPVTDTVTGDVKEERGEGEGISDVCEVCDNSSDSTSTSVVADALPVSTEALVLPDTSEGKSGTSILGMDTDTHTEVVGGVAASDMGVEGEDREAGVTGETETEAPTEAGADSVTEAETMWGGLSAAFRYFVSTTPMRYCLGLAAGVQFYVIFKPLFYYDYLVKTVGVSDRGVSLVAMGMAATTIVMLLLVIPRVPPRLVPQALSLGLLIGAVAVSLLVVLETHYYVPLLATAVLLDGISIAVMRPMVDTLWSDMLEDERRASQLAGGHVLFSLIALPAGSAAAELYKWIPASPFVAASLMLLGMAACSYILGHYLRKEAQVARDTQV